MAEVNRFSEGLVDLAERFADVVDAAQGKGARKAGPGARWLILPAAGATAYALVTSSSSMARKTRGLMRRAKDRATDLPDVELFGRVKEVTGQEQTPSGNRGRARARRTSTRRARPSQAQRRRKAAST